MLSPLNIKTLDKYTACEGFVVKDIAPRVEGFDRWMLRIKNVYRENPYLMAKAYVRLFNK